jgi:hypothetical protein
MVAVNGSPPTPPLVTQLPAAPARIGSGGAGKPAGSGQGSAATSNEIPEAPAESEPLPKPSPEQAAKNLKDAEAALREAEAMSAAQERGIKAKFDAELTEIDERPGVPGNLRLRQIEDARDAANKAVSEAQRPVELLRRSVDLLRRSVDAMRHPHKYLLKEAKARSDQAKSRLVEAKAAAQIAYDEAKKADEAYRVELANDPEWILDWDQLPPSAL